MTIAPTFRSNGGFPAMPVQNPQALRVRDVPQGLDRLSVRKHLAGRGERNFLRGAIYFFLFLAHDDLLLLHLRIALVLFASEFLLKS